ncbi:MAG: hypothetical protein H7Y18_07640 [Clostridiaceae bacterium]|nr:hypothetical protein [Clostridiaceae bacterium]
MIDNKIIGSIIIGDKSLSMKLKQAVEKGEYFLYAMFNSADNIIQKLRVIK